MLRIVETSLVYGYEYFGAYERLVMSELTEKCYKVLNFFLFLFTEKNDKMTYFSGISSYN